MTIPIAPDRGGLRSRMLGWGSALAAVGLSVGAAAGQVRPCPAPLARNDHRATDPRPGGVQAGGVQTAQADRGQAAQAGRDQVAVANNYDRGQDPRSSGFGRTDTNVETPEATTTTESAGAGPAGCK